MIYRPLLIAKYTKREHNMTSKEYDGDRQAIQNGPDQTYQFHPAIFRTNRRIYEEARDLCRRENNFICLTSESLSCLGDRLEQRGLQTIARVSKARGFWNASMTISLDPTRWADWESGDSVDVTEDGGPWSYVFCSDELPEFCRLVSSISESHEDVIGRTTLNIDINPAIGNGQAVEMESSPAGLARLRKLLDTLHQLYGFGAAIIQGPFSEGYKEEITASVCMAYPTAMDVIHKVLVSLEHADEEVRKGQMTQANVRYKATLSLIESCCYGNDEGQQVLDNGPFPGLAVRQVVPNIAVRLHARIAGVYFESGKMRMARIYSERALDSRRRYDRGWKVKDIEVEPWEGVVYAEVLHVAAQISYSHGGVREATINIRDAAELVPLNQEQEFRYKAWQSQVDKLYRRSSDRYRAKNRQSEKQDEKSEAMFLVVCNWKKNGDRLLQRGISDLACTKYKTALSKIDVMDRDRELWFRIQSGPFEGYHAEEGIQALRFKLRASVAASYLMSRSYEDILPWVDAALECKHHNGFRDRRYHSYCSHEYRESPGDWAVDQKLDYLRLYYCRALALHHAGDTVGAIAHMEEALSFDRRDRTVSAQLVSLKWQLRRERMKREKLDKPHRKLREKQARRKGKAGKACVKKASQDNPLTETNHPASVQTVCFRRTWGWKPVRRPQV